ncbi:MAG: hypothetical protein ACTSSG_03000 [Candidatus Heimdallarchaeaceae archaeon]
MSENETIVNYVLRQELNSRKLSVSENVSFRFGRRNYTIDFYLKKQKIGIITLNWKRTIPTNKLLQLEQLINSLKLKKLVLICNSISGNAKDFLSRRDIPIEVVHLNEIIYKEKSVEDLMIGC